MKQFFGMVSTLVLLCFCLAWSDSTKTASSAMSEVGAPPEMRQLATLVGTWDIVNQEKVPGKDEWKESKATAEFHYILDSCALELNYKGEYEGKPFGGYAIRCWNRYTSRWEMVWADDYMAMLGMHYGESTDWKAPMTWKEDNMPGGGSMWGRITWSNVTADSMDWTYEMSMDKGATWTHAVKAHYTRRK